MNVNKLLRASLMSPKEPEPRIPHPSSSPATSPCTWRLASRGSAAGERLRRQHRCEGAAGDTLRRSPHSGVENHE
ncbi:hypothetical protein E2C01_092489 [Portunus trituberculatus]|uniref:Uncharacterized protein n=1 Tax=Portunus trituberculatus TaxID=210409 RepID=A0A5B7JVX6_PORTR|nr:hypothetical protein [Portunus trituberculatus]